MCLCLTTLLPSSKVVNLFCALKTRTKNGRAWRASRRFSVRSNGLGFSGLKDLISEVVMGPTGRVNGWIFIKNRCRFYLNEVMLIGVLAPRSAWQKFES